uniref:ANK_REP_REGION domain-containing protein n=1 Tax=Elaeophora elaphi TaxID=1147741 RepID=A0A0R3RZZ0_9BILA
MVKSDAGKFYLKVEKGRKPRIQLFEELRNAQVTVPYDQSTKWPPIRVQMSGGITIIVQRLEQQYKIIVQHVMERKPDICVYVSALTHERDIRTCVRDINTQLSHVGVAGPNLEVTGRIKAIKVTFESTVGALHTNSKLSAHSIVLKAQHIFIKPEALFTCSKLRMISRRVQIDGRICCSEQMPSKMSVFIDSALLHIGVDGTIGTTRSSTDKSISKLSENLVNVLHFRLTGCLANFGSIASQNEMEFHIDGSVLSLQDSRIDSASRGYAALKQIKGISSEASDSLPTSSTLSSAILYEKPDTVAQLLEDGVDLNDSIKTNNTDDDTPRKIAVRKYKAIQASERRNKMREKITLIQALISTHDWKRGVITSNNINAKIGRDCADCAQFRSGTLALTVYGNAKCEAKSIWTGGSVTVTVGHDLIIEGQVKHVNLDVSCGGNMATSEESIISQEQWVKIVSSAFCVAGIWSVGEQFGLDAKSATFLEESYMEVDFFEGTISECCYNSGTWQARFVSLAVRGDLFTLHTGKVFVEETTIIEALSFNNCGLWKIKEAIKIILKGSANFYASSKLSANLLKLIAEGQCTIAGHLSLENLLVYARNDMITAPGSRVNVTIGATVAVGTFRNDSSWYLDGNLHLHVACFEQSEDALIFVKDTFAMVVYDVSEERCQGRIVANYLIMNLAKRVRFDGYVRVNQIEICVPHVNESRLTIGGQLEVLDGPVILKGRSCENSETSSSAPSSSVVSSIAAHAYPAFILEGQLKAEAVIAPFLAILFSTSSYSLLSGLDSVSKDATYRTLISCNSLHTQRTSLIDSTPEGLFPEGISCATTWLHEGQIRFNGEKVYIITDGLVNRGRLTSGDKLQNHMREVVVVVENFFRNDAVFSADHIEIRGNGELQNTNRIFANDEMNIRLANFCSEFGQTQLEGAQPKLLSASNECTYVGGRIEARGKFDSSASKSCLALNRYGHERQVRISARSRLLIDNDIIDGRRNIALSARDAILFKSRINVDLLELTLGTAYITEFVVKNGASVSANQLRITGSCKYLTLIVDGELSCESMIIDARIRQVKVVGGGMLFCRKSCNIGGDSITLTTRDIRITELMASAVTITSDGSLRLSPFDCHLKTVSIYADSCHLQGRIFVEHKIVLKISDGACHISGEILGTSANSELSLECGDLILTGTVANLDFLESYTRVKIEHHETGIIKSVKNVVFEAEFISLVGKIMDSESLIATGEEVNIEGIFQNHESTNVAYSIFGKKILFDGEVRGPARLDLSGSEISFFGVSSSLKFLDIDANLATITPRGLKCENLNFIGFSAILDGNLNVENFGVTVQIALFIRTDLTNCAQCKFVAPLILALNCPMSSKMDICSLIFAFERFELLKSEKLPELSESKQQFASNDAEISYSKQFLSKNSDCASQSFIEISFHSGTVSHYTLKEYDLWRKTTKIIGECLKNSHPTYDELQKALRRTDQLRPISVSLPTTSPLYRTLSKLVNEIHLEHILMRNFAKLFHLMCSIADIKDDNELQHSEIFIDEQQRFESQGLYEAANRFRIRSRKFGLQRSENHSVDDDIGYVSRSSSEEIDEKRRNINDPRDVLYCTNLDNESLTSMSKVTISDEDDCMEKDTVTDDELRNNEMSNDETRRRQKVENNYSTTYVLNGERRIPISYIDFDRFDVVITKPEFLTRRKIPSVIDLAFKKMQVKATLPTLELHSFCSESSLASFDEKALMHSIPTPVKRSLIPRAAIPANSSGAIRKPYTVITYDT